MTQEASVLSLIPGDKAVVSVKRSTACGGNCESCENCVYQTDLHVIAVNKLNAQIGQKVIIETDSKYIYGAIFRVYVLPIIFFLLGYIVFSLFHVKESFCILASFIMLAVSAFILVMSQKKMKNKDITYKIIQII